MDYTKAVPLKFKEPAPEPEGYWLSKEGYKNLLAAAKQNDHIREQNKELRQQLEEVTEQREDAFDRLSVWESWSEQIHDKAN